MTDEKPKNKYGATPGKLVLIGVLAFALLFVVYRNLFSGSNDSAKSAGRRDDSEESDAATGVSNGSDTKGATTAVDRLAARLRSKPWPAFPLAAVADYDPFALPSAFPRPKEATLDENGLLQSSDDNESALAAKQAELAAAQAAAAAAIQQQGVQVIFKSADEFVAVIGDREVRVGDEVAGYVVVEIGNDGVTLDRMKIK